MSTRTHAAIVVVVLSSAVGLLLPGCEGGVGTHGPQGWETGDGGGAQPGADGGWWAGDLGGLAPDLFAAAPEQCNGLDDDLDGKVDEGCSCKKGATQACFPGQASQLTGLCKQGTQTCIATAEFGTWGPCTGAVLPAKEVCGDSVDQDCDGKDLPCPGKSQCDAFAFGKTSRPVDIVWVIDQSGSMGDEIQGVRNHMNLFAGQIAKANVDYRVTLLAARFNDKDNHEVCIPPPLAGAGCKDGPRFKQIDQHVDSHDALARIVQYIGVIEGFMRKGSARRFVVVTDDEAKKTTATGFHAFLRSRPGYSDYRFHSIVALWDKGCAADEGKEYIRLSNLTGGITTHICNANWQSVFTSLAKEATGVSAQFLLSKTPRSGTIQVTIAGKPATLGVHYTYDANVNQVVLKQPYPSSGAAVRVCYDW